MQKTDEGSFGAERLKRVNLSVSRVKGNEMCVFSHNEGGTATTIALHTLCEGRFTFKWTFFTQKKQIDEI